MDALEPETEAAPQADPRAIARRTGHTNRLLRKRLAAARRGRILQWLLPWARRLATFATMPVVVVVALVTWDYYITAPWTRDGRVRVQMVSVAPQVSGQITELRVSDNQFVRKGDVLYVIDPFDFEVTLRSNEALLEQKAADLQVKLVQTVRRQHLSALATTPEERQVFAGTLVQAKAAFDAAQQQVYQAEINLRRTEVRSPVNGYVTNLLIGVGDYAREGTTNISVIDSDSYWIDGYFEKTKMAQVCIGDRVEAKLMGYAQPILGHVSTVTLGDPVYTWVRLAQRVPVRIAIDKVPPGVPLVAGMTATVTVLESGQARRRSGWEAMVAALQARLADVFEGPPAKPDCIPAITTDRGQTESLPAEVEKPDLTPGQINPGLAPGMSVSLQVR